jgi:alpha-mannosidase
MNNHWHTNYRADQEGPTVFRFAIRAHKRFEPEAAATFGTECAQPLLATTAASRGNATSRLRLSSDEVLITALKPSDDGKADVVRLFGASGKTQRVRLHWSDPAPRQVWISDLSQKQARVAGHTIEVPGWGLITLRAER